MSKKPATESTAAQGKCKSEEVLFPDQTVNLNYSQLFSNPPGIAPGRGTFLTEYPGITQE